MFFKRNFDAIGYFIRIHNTRKENLNNCIMSEAQEPFNIFRKCHGVQLIVDIKNKIHFTSEELFFGIIICVFEFIFGASLFFLVNLKKRMQARFKVGIARCIVYQIKSNLYFGYFLVV